MTAELKLAGGPDNTAAWLWLQKNTETLIPWMQEYFKCYSGVKQWLEENQVSFTIEKESWA